MYVTPSDTIYTLEKEISKDKVGVIEKPFMTIKINSGDYTMEQVIVGLPAFYRFFIKKPYFGGLTIRT